METLNLTRRAALAGGGAALGVALFASRASAQTGPITIGCLVPLTGAGSIYGPGMRDAIAAVVKQVNGAGGVLGQQIQLVTEDDQTNPEAAVRAIRKLINVDKSVAVLGPWASSVAAAVAPLCWENQTLCAIVGSADSITRLPHQGFLIRTQPSISMQAARFGKLAIDLGGKSIYFLGPQTPFTQTYIDVVAKMAHDKGLTFNSQIYDGSKTSFRSEIDSMRQVAPDTVLLGGYVTDIAVVLRELYRANFTSRLIGFGTGVNTSLLQGMPKEAVEGVYAVTPSASLQGSAYQKLAALVGNPAPGPFEAQAYDMINLTVLAIAQAGKATGVAARDAIRTVSQGDGTVVDNAPDGLALIAKGQKVNYEGASGSCDFDQYGDIVAAKFKIERVLNGQITTVEIS
ncbi:MAG: amino acid transporter substrate-binding protein [Rhodospirillales bacterium]|jgi:branched-chain amino acid transport system substrate-binding protein|nr:amino acid transporter substrate-binding protein [Rhodospirillales bacterium]